MFGKLRLNKPIHCSMLPCTPIFLPQCSWQPLVQVKYNSVGNTLLLTTAVPNGYTDKKAANMFQVQVLRNCWAFSYSLIK